MIYEARPLDNNSIYRVNLIRTRCHFDSNFCKTMISENQVKKYCREDISLIENYDQAMNDKTQTWDCHHRKESQYSVAELVDIGEYYGVLASDLIFLTHSEHSKLHNVFQHYHIGSSNSMWGKHHSEGTKKMISLRHKGSVWFNNGIISVRRRECPEGFVPGRIVCNKRP